MSRFLFLEVSIVHIHETASGTNCNLPSPPPLTSCLRIWSEPGGQGQAWGESGCPGPWGPCSTHGADPAHLWRQPLTSSCSPSPSSLWSESTRGFRVASSRGFNPGYHTQPFIRESLPTQLTLPHQDLAHQTQSPAHACGSLVLQPAAQHRSVPHRDSSESIENLLVSFAPADSQSLLLSVGGSWVTPR